MTLLAAALLGIVQGITEFLPVSSTAHLLLVGEAIGHDDPGGVFTVMIQLGSIFAVVWLYRTKILKIVSELRTSADARHFAAAIIIATIPALAAGALLADYIQSVLYKSPRVFAFAFIGGGLVMLLVERFRPAPVVLDAERTPLGRALGVGLCQMLALVPGVSRSGATITLSMLLNVERASAARFVFLMSLPAIIAAAAKEALDLSEVGMAGLPVTLLAIGLVVSAVVGYITVKFFVRYLASHSLEVFAYYRFVLAAITVLWLWWR